MVIHEAPVGALADDVICSRHQAVVASTNHNLAQIARAYRTYLQVCISLVDAFLGHATFALGEATPNIATSSDFQTVKSTSPFADRLDAWCRLWGHARKSFGGRRMVHTLLG